MRWICAVVLIQFLHGCGSGPSYDWESVDEDATSSKSSSLVVEWQSSPSVSWSAADGKTTLILQFTVRDGDGLALEPSEVSATLSIDGSPLDSESLLQSDSIILRSDILVSFLLDGSYSMLQHDPPAFEPMLQAAAASAQQVVDLWSARSGDVAIDVSWFDEEIAVATGDWNPSDITSIPAPSAGTATKLFAAVEATAQSMAERREQGIAAGDRDHHIMVVFSDGADNYSFFGNDADPISGVTTTGAPYERAGWPATDLSGAITAIDAHPRLKVHTIGFGGGVDEAALTDIADAGHGTFFNNPSTGELEDVFKDALREVATLQIQGATVPLQPGEYSLALNVVSNEGGKGALEFRFRTGDATASVLP